MHSRKRDLSLPQIKYLEIRGLMDYRTTTHLALYTLLYTSILSLSIFYCPDHRLRPIDTHLALYTMLYNNSAKNRYAEPVHNKTKQI